MSLSLSGYKIGDRIHEGSRSVVYRAVRESDNQPVIIKALKTAYPTHRDISRFKYGYEILKSLNIHGVARAYGLEKHNNSLALILEYIKGESLKNFIQSNTIELKDFLHIATPSII